VQQQAAIILKPAILKKGKVGDVISAIERAGCNIQDLFLLPIGKEDLNEAFAIVNDLPNYETIKEFKEGPSVLLLISFPESALTKVAKMKEYIKHYPFLWVENALVIQFWFGGSPCEDKGKSKLSLAN